ncbi:hypothetical protein D3C71_1657160 [compost metagenome]
MGRRLALAQLAQHVELAAAHEVVALAPLDHFLQHLAAVGLLGQRRVGGWRVQLRPVFQGISNELGHLREKAA